MHIDICNLYIYVSISWQLTNITFLSKIWFSKLLLIDSIETAVTTSWKYQAPYSALPRFLTQSLFFFPFDCRKMKIEFGIQCFCEACLKLRLQRNRSLVGEQKTFWGIRGRVVELGIYRDNACSVSAPSIRSSSKGTRRCSCSTFSLLARTKSRLGLSR